MYLSYVHEKGSLKKSTLFTVTTYVGIQSPLSSYAIQFCVHSLLNVF